MEKNLISKRKTIKILKISYSLSKSVSPNNLPRGIDYNPLLAVSFIYKYLPRSDSKCRSVLCPFSYKYILYMTFTANFNILQSIEIERKEIRKFAVC